MSGTLHFTVYQPAGNVFLPQQGAASETESIAIIDQYLFSIVMRRGHLPMFRQAVCFEFEITLYQSKDLAQIMFEITFHQQSA